MNMVDLDRDVIGCFGIVGGSIAAATGAALALKGSGRIATAFFGDGATNQAYFFECLNFAKVLGLPALFVCENNGYGEYTPTDAVTAGTISARAEAMEIPTDAVDGMDVWAVREAALAAVERVRGERAPVFVEARTYRFVGHSRSDPGKYRPAGELEEWQRARPAADRRAAPRRRARRHGRATPGGRRRRRAASSSEAERDGLAAPFPAPAPLTEFKE